MSDLTLIIAAAVGEPDGPAPVIYEFIILHFAGWAVSTFGMERQISSREILNQYV